MIRLLATELEDAEDAEVVDEELVNSLKSRLNSIKVRNIIILRISYKNGDDDDDASCSLLTHAPCEERLGGGGEEVCTL